LAGAVSVFSLIVSSRALMLTNCLDGILFIFIASNFLGWDQVLAKHKEPIDLVVLNVE